MLPITVHPHRAPPASREVLTALRCPIDGGEVAVLAVRWLTMGCSGVGGTGELMRGSWVASGTKEAVPGRRWGAGGARPLPCRGLEPTACGGDPALCCHCGVWLSSPIPGQFGVSPHHAAFSPHPWMLWGQPGGNFGVLQVPPSLLPPLWGPPSRGTSGTPTWRSVGSPIPTHSAIQQGADLGKLRGGWGGAVGGVGLNLHGDTVTTVAMARLRGPARCHGDAPGTTSRHGDGRWMEWSPWRGPGAGMGPWGGGGRGPTVGPRGGRAPSRCAWVGAVRRRVPPPPGFICTRLFHSSSHYHLTSPTSHFQSNHSTALIAHANMQIRIN